MSLIYEQILAFGVTPATANLGPYPYFYSCPTLKICGSIVVNVNHHTTGCIVVQAPTNRGVSAPGLRLHRNDWMHEHAWSWERPNAVVDVIAAFYDLLPRRRLI